jgi:predicted dehydrogenase
MSGSRTIAVIGRGDMVDAVTQAIRRSPTHRLAGSIGAGEDLPKDTDLVLNLATGAEQISVLRALESSSLPVATLPLSSSDDAARAALGSGRVVQVNPLRGFEALEAFRTDVRGGRAGTPYGIFGAHRVRQGRADLFESIGVPLLHFALELFDEPLVRVQTTRANLFGSEGDAWFIIARGNQNLIVTLEFAASLSDNAPAPEQILFEATGADGVLRVEPSRQVVQVSGRDGHTRDVAWWPDEAPGFVDAAVQATDIHEPAREMAFLDFVSAVKRSAESGQTIEMT